MAPAEILGLEVPIERLKVWLHMFGTHNVKTSAVHYLVLKKDMKNKRQKQPLCNLSELLLH